MFFDYCIFSNTIIPQGKSPGGALFMAIVFLLLIALLAFTLLGVVKVKSDMPGKQLTISTLFGKQILSVDQITSYYMTI